MTTKKKKITKKNFKKIISKKIKYIYKKKQKSSKTSKISKTSSTDSILESKTEINKFVNDFINNYFSPKDTIFNILEKQERYAAYNLGKGYGANTIKNEVKSCLSLFNFRPYIFIDIGANKGDYTKEILKQFPDIEIYMFEPSKYHKNNLYELYGKNPKIHINNIGLSNKSYKTILYSDHYGSALSSLTQRQVTNIDFNYKEEVEIQRFDEFWNTTSNFNNIMDYVKIDVEGNELDVLEGMGKYINKIRLIQFEFGGTNIDTRTYFKDFWNYFNKHNFSIYRITPKGLLYIYKYWEMDEVFLTTNYIAFNKNDIL